ncbi:hypothetical protein LIER_06704 [Lithospermum erythrorhizon]|uniref:Uncharacterized protein n=1 Tax=Lithospermum erythrorhizon TaxID=34254 RepID=A0AAV3PA39_LITER
MARSTFMAEIRYKSETIKVDAYFVYVVLKMLRFLCLKNEVTDKLSSMKFYSLKKSSNAKLSEQTKTKFGTQQTKTKQIHQLEAIAFATMVLKRQAMTCFGEIFRGNMDI